MTELRRLQELIVSMAQTHLKEKGYFDSLEKYRGEFSYIQTIQSALEEWKERFRDYSPEFIDLVTYEVIETDVFNNLCLEINRFLTQTEKYHPPLEDEQKVMKIALETLSVDVERILGKVLKTYTMKLYLFVF